MNELAPGALQLAQELHRAYNAHAPDEAAALYAPSAVHTEVARNHRAQGPDEIQQGLARFLALFPDAHWEALGEIDRGGMAAVPYRLTGTLQAPMGPIRARGQRLDLRGSMSSTPVPPSLQPPRTTGMLRRSSFR